MGTEWGGRNERQKLLGQQGRIARLLESRPGTLRGMLDASIDSIGAKTPDTKPDGPIEMPAAERIPRSERIIDALSAPGAHGAEMRSAQDAIHEPNPLDNLQKQ